MTSSSDLPNYSESARSEKYVAPEQVPNDPKPYGPTGGQGAYPSPTYMPPATHVQYVPQSYMQPGHVFMAPQIPVDPSINQIRDWLPWSIVNIFIGWGLLGLVPLIFSLICRSKKRSNDASGARTMSTLALVFNILITLGGIAAWIGLIVAVVLTRTAVSSYVTRCYYPYC